MKNATQLSQLGSKLREQDKHLQAATTLTQAIILAQQEGNFRLLIDCLKDRCLTWKHFFLLTNDSVFITLAQKDAESMLAIATDKKLSDKLATSYFRLGEIAMEAQNFSQAVSYYQKSLHHYHQPDAEMGDYTYHLGEALYKNGQKETSLIKFDEGIKILQQYQPSTDSFVYHVWLSGAYLRLAQLLLTDNKPLGQKYLKLAKKIIDSDPRLIIRHRQLDQLSQQY